MSNRLLRPVLSPKSVPPTAAAAGVTALDNTSTMCLKAMGAARLIALSDITSIKHTSTRARNMPVLGQTKWKADAAICHLLSPGRLKQMTQQQDSSRAGAEAENQGAASWWMSNQNYWASHAMLMPNPEQRHMVQQPFEAEFRSMSVPASRCKPCCCSLFDKHVASLPF